MFECIYKAKASTPHACARGKKCTKLSEKTNKPNKKEKQSLVPFLLKV